MQQRDVDVTSITSANSKQSILKDGLKKEGTETGTKLQPLYKNTWDCIKEIYRYVGMMNKLLYESIILFSSFKITRFTWIF